MTSSRRIGIQSRRSAHAQANHSITRPRSDINKTATVDFDFFLRSFISRCLDGDKQSRFESIQGEIEELQSERFGPTALRRISKVQGNESMLETSPLNHRESELVKQRDDVLNEVLDQCLHSVLDIANRADIRAMLTKFTDIIETGSAEKARYRPYIDVHNAALRELATLSLSCLRPPGLPLQLSRADPEPITASLSDSKEVVGRLPELLLTPGSATCANHSKNDERKTNEKGCLPNGEDVGKQLPMALTWSQVTSSTEMKTVKQQRFASPAESHIQCAFSSPETLEHIQAQIKPGKKCRHSRPNNVNPSTQKRVRVRTSITSTSTTSETNSDKYVDARELLAGYAMKMMSYGAGAAHVINMLVIDELLYLSHYDSQGSIHSDGISILADFPRFLVLLLACQRLTIEDWDVVPYLDPQALHGPGIRDHADSEVVRLSGNDLYSSGVLLVQPKSQFPTVIELNCHSSRVSKNLGASALNGSGEWPPPAYELSQSQAQRIPGGDILRTAQVTPQDRTAKIPEHLPELYSPGNLRAAGDTLRVRSITDLNGKGHGTLRVLVINELEPLTTLTGESFVQTWLDVVACHAFLWKQGVQHGDPSLSNMMYNPVKQCGVLTDFDVSVMPWLEGVPGNDRIGTIPLMALDLLKDDYWEGYRERCYHHELEAFIWTLLIVLIAYANGKRDQGHKFTQGWFTSNYLACCSFKWAFLTFQSNDADLSADFEQYDELLYDITKLLHHQYYIRIEARAPQNRARRRRARTEHLEDSTCKDKQKEADSTQDDTKALKLKFSEAMWTQFIAVLSKISAHPNIKREVTRLEMHKPTFDIAQCQLLFGDADHSNARDSTS